MATSRRGVKKNRRAEDGPVLRSEACFYEAVTDMVEVMPLERARLKVYVVPEVNVTEPDQPETVT